MNILGIIPARYASTRFPGKPLIDINGRSMILRVYDRALLSGVFREVLVATDDERISDHVRAAGYHSVMTSRTHRSGTERCLEALLSWEQEHGTFDHIINIQGDEPYIHPEQIRKVASLLINDNARLATLAKLITSHEEIFDPHVVKVIFSREMNALYFSRSPVPYIRDVNENEWPGKRAHFKHIGIYGFTKEALVQACRLPEGILEKHEALEQLRWLEHGLQIKLGLTDLESFSVDTPEDLSKITNTP
ncbi:MAG: 3-deoxy-manno-octulosonate cytidylyltransferase [Bacteroidales bacterium]|nr:3-deoxy-manno-octulosonate cytidylyltransferase [Bacteroidales bacterium]